MVVPTMLARVVEHLGDGATGRPPRRLRSLAYGGARMPVSVLERALGAFPDTDFVNAYGLTETSSHHRRPRPRRPPGRAGDDRRRPASARPAGSCPASRSTSATASSGCGASRCRASTSGAGAAVDADGWFPTRDRGWVDDDGYLFIEGRADDTIIRGGENIAPAEIEDVLLAPPRRASTCAVVGLPDEEWGQRIAAAVVLRARATSVDEAELQRLGARAPALVARRPTSSPSGTSCRTPTPASCSAASVLADLIEERALMAFDLDDLVACLDLTEVEPGVVEGAEPRHRLPPGLRRPDPRPGRSSAAAGASPDKSVKSLHVLFPREGDTAKPMRYRVEQLQDGRTFGTTEVVAEPGRQGDRRRRRSRCTSTRTASTAATRRPRRRRPRTPTPVDLGMVPWETRLVGGVDLGRPGRRPAAARLVDADAAGGRRPRRPPGPARPRHRPHAHRHRPAARSTACRQADSTVTLHTAVTRHTLWFHQPFRVDDWLLLTQHSPVVADGRSFGRGDVFAGDELVASFAQEAMVRQIPG